MAAKKKKKPSGNTVAQNRKARRDYTIVETFEAGIMLLGTEVKSLRAGRASIGEAYAVDKNNALYLSNAFIPAYESAGYMTHDPRAPRKLLLHRREITKLMAAINRKGMTLVPLSIYFNDRGIAKVQLALAEGKQKADRRQDAKTRDWQRDKARLMRDKG
ncbi:MAG: SsrA-binding protein SmpB [Alphaproteobacteria bacterium]|jgi:SsrA-binding protein|nr:SsrA-binding protein SmpB [Alphaproteobacteria bacterium]